MATSLDRLFQPRSIAVIGANEKTGYGGRFMRNLMKNGYQGKIYPVNPTHSTVYDLPAYPTIGDVPGEVDLATIIVKAEFVVETMKQCAAKGVGSVLIITAGFSELDPEHGPAMEQEIRRIARENDMRVVGPNCIGLANVALNMWACSLSTLPLNPLSSGKSALVSQSGATGFGPLLSIAQDQKVGLKYIVSTGNETDLNMCDYINYMLDDPDIRSVAVLIEGLKEPKQFIETAKKAKRLGKTIVALKMGESEVGSRAAASHTASMTGDMAVFNAMTKQYGVIKAEDYEELIQLARITQMEKKLSGPNLAAISHSGGICGCTGDQLGKYGFQVPVLSEATQQKIDSYLKGFGSPKNPLDLTGQMRKPHILDIVQAINANEPIDGYVFSSHGASEGMENIIRAANSVDKPTYFVWTGSVHHEGLNTVLASDLPVCFSIQKFAKMLAKVYEAQQYQLDESNCEAVVADITLDSCDVDEMKGKELLAKIGVSVPVHQMLTSEEQVRGLFSAFPRKRFVLKIVSKTILHKSDMGGVKLGIDTEEKAVSAYRELVALMAANSEIEGIAAEEMCEEGLDLVLGIRHDTQYGHVIMLGLGGIYTELFKLISLRTLPISEAEIGRMIGEIKGLDKLFAGYRGQPPLDLEAFTATVKLLSDFVCKHGDQIKLLEINPIRILEKGNGAYALDCVMTF